MPSLQNLDNEPCFERSKRLAVAFMQGGVEAEKEMRVRFVGAAAGLQAAQSAHPVPIWSLQRRQQVLLLTAFERSWLLSPAVASPPAACLSSAMCMHRVTSQQQQLVLSTSSPNLQSESRTAAHRVLQHTVAHRC
jgi:hypothetical protein